MIGRLVNGGGGGAATAAIVIIERYYLVVRRFLPSHESEMVDDLWIWAVVDAQEVLGSSKKHGGYGLMIVLLFNDSHIEWDIDRPNYN